MDEQTPPQKQKFSMGGAHNCHLNTLEAGSWKLKYASWWF